MHLEQIQTKKHPFQIGMYKNMLSQLGASPELQMWLGWRSIALPYSRIAPHPFTLEPTQTNATSL